MGKGVRSGSGSGSGSEHPEPDYADLIHMLQNGYITSEGLLSSPVQDQDRNNIPVVWRSLQASEISYLSLRFGSPLREGSSHSHSYPHGRTSEFAFEHAFIAASVLFFDGLDILALPERDEWICEAADVLATFEAQQVNALLDHLRHLNRKASALVQGVHGFTFDPQSKHLWSTVKTGTPLDLLNLYGHHPPAGASSLGMRSSLGATSHHVLWFYLNRWNDDHERLEAEWNATKFLASVHTDEIAKINAEDKRRLRDLRASQKRIWLKGQYPQDQEGPPAEIEIESEIEIEIGIGIDTPKISPESAEELHSQLLADMQGVQDFHDRAVAEHEARARARLVEQREKLRKRRLASIQNRRGVFEIEASSSSSSSSSAAPYYTSQDIDQAKAKQKAALAKGLDAARAYERLLAAEALLARYPALDPDLDPDPDPDPSE